MADMSDVPNLLCDIRDAIHDLRATVEATQPTPRDRPAPAADTKAEMATAQGGDEGGNERGRDDPVASDDADTHLDAFSYVLVRGPHCFGIVNRVPCSHCGSRGYRVGMFEWKEATCEQCNGHGHVFCRSNTRRNAWVVK